MIEAAARAAKRYEQSRGNEIEGALQSHGAAAQRRWFGRGGACGEGVEVDRPSSL